jgi:tetratricopeptide (TPR) repeat protein
MPEITVTSLDPRIQKQLENAQTALQRGNFDYVIEVTTQVLKTAPACLPVRRLQRAAQMRLFQSKNKMLTKAFGSVTQAGFLFSGAKKDPAKTLENAEKLLVSDPTSVPALKLLAEAAAGLDLMATVAWAWECIHELQPTDREALLQMGEASLAAKLPKEALRAADMLLKMRPQDGDALNLMRKASIAQTSEAGKWEEKGSFRDKLKDEALAVSLEQASKVVTSDEMNERLIKEAMERHQKQPDNMDHIRTIFEGYRKANNLAEALVWMQKARELPSGKADTSLEKQEAELRVSILEKNIKEFETAVASAPADVELKSKLDAARTELANFRLSDSKSYVERYPNDYAARFTLANLYFDLHDYQNAIANYQQAQKNPKVRIPALAGMGKALKARKMFDLAVAQLKNAKSELTTMDEVKKDVIYELADCFEKMGKKAEAVEEYKVLYSDDISYRDVADKINAFYASQ